MGQRNGTGTKKSTPIPMLECVRMDRYTASTYTYVLVTARPRPPAARLRCSRVIDRTMIYRGKLPGHRSEMKIIFPRDITHTFVGRALSLTGNATLYEQTLDSGSYPPTDASCKSQCRQIVHVPESDQGSCLSLSSFTTIWIRVFDKDRKSGYRVI